jgi:glycosyltransferase involved in cell wall biosynthesis
MIYLSLLTKIKILRIAVNTRLLQKNKLEGIGRFSYETLKRIVLTHPEVDFIFCFDREFDSEFVFAKNVKPIIISPQARHPLLYYIWFQWRLPAVLKKEKVDIFLSPDGFLPLNSKIKTVAIIHDIAFEHFPNGVDWLTQKYYKQYFPKFAKQSGRIATVSNFTKNDLIKSYGIDSHKIDVVYNGVSSSFKPLKDEEKVKIIEKETNGNPYFVCLGSIHPRKNSITLLKAFQKFKSENPHYPHQLIFVGRMAWKNSEIEEYLKSMSFRKSILFKGVMNDTEISKILASATASIYPSLFEGFGLPVVESFACGTPIITSKGTAMEEISKGAAFLFNPLNVDELVQQMMFIVKNESVVNEKVAHGLAVAEEYNWDTTADLLWKSILKAKVC